MLTATQSSQVKQRRIGFFEETFESAYQSFTGTEKPEAPKTQHGGEQSMTGFQTPRGKENILAQRAMSENIKQSIAAVSAEVASKDPIRQKLIKTNAEAGINNLLYEDTINLKTGEVRIDIQTAIDRANSDKTSNEIKRDRQKQVAQALGQEVPEDFMGENELGLGGENKNHFTAAIG